MAMSRTPHSRNSSRMAPTTTAGAVRPDNAQRLAFGELKIDALGNHDRAEAFADLLKRE